MASQDAWKKKTDWRKGKGNVLDLPPGQKSNKEIRKPKKEQPRKANASNPSVKPGVIRGLDNMSNDR